MMFGLRQSIHNVSQFYMLGWFIRQQHFESLTIPAVYNVGTSRISIGLSDRESEFELNR